jgi:hypothetical protein
MEGENHRENDNDQGDAAQLMLEQIPDNGASRWAATGFRHAGVRRRMPPNERHAACGAERLSLESKETQTDRGMFGWLNDIALLRKLKHRAIFKVGFVLHLCGSSLQPGAAEKTGSNSVRSL